GRVDRRHPSPGKTRDRPEPARDAFAGRPVRTPESDAAACGVTAAEFSDPEPEDPAASRHMLNVTSPRPGRASPARRDPACYLRGIRTARITRCGEVTSTAQGP